MEFLIPQSSAGSAPASKLIPCHVPLQIHVGIGGDTAKAETIIAEMCHFVRSAKKSQIHFPAKEHRKLIFIINQTVLTDSRRTVFGARFRDPCPRPPWQYNINP